MTALYGFFAVVGGVLALLMLIGVGDTDADFDVDLDVDLDVDPGIDMSADHMSSGAGDVLQSLFSFRTLVFVAAFFGITGLILPLTGAGDITTFIAAIGVGGFAGFTNDRLIRYVKRTSGGIGDRVSDIAGHPANVTIPIEAGRRGQINVEVEGQTLKLVAEPYRTDGDSFVRGDTVVVVEMNNGVARVAPLELE